MPDIICELQPVHTLGPLATKTMLNSDVRFVRIVLKKSVACLVCRWFTVIESGGAAMMGPRQVAQGALFYEFSIEEFVPAGHPLRGIDRFLDLSDVRPLLASSYSSHGRPSID